MAACLREYENERVVSFFSVLTESKIERNRWGRQIISPLSNEHTVVLCQCQTKATKGNYNSILWQW